MKKISKNSSALLPAELKLLVKEVTTLFGDVIRSELGAAAFKRIEKIRENMALLRGKSQAVSVAMLKKTLHTFDQLKSEDLHAIATSFTLMLEIMNVCENAYRSHRLSSRVYPNIDRLNKPEAIVYVLTAHPTEARSPQNIAVFHQIQHVLISTLQHEDTHLTSTDRLTLTHLLNVAWRTSIVRNRAPKVKDEAEHIYSTLFRDEVLFSLLDMSQERAPIQLRSWVGGDKDGHPGVNEVVMLQSFSISRLKVIQTVQRLLTEVRKTLDYFPSKKLHAHLMKLNKKLSNLKTIRASDAKKVILFRAEAAVFNQAYVDMVGETHPSLKRIQQLFELFPGLVVPLELRESSDILMLKQKGFSQLAIDKMLREIAKISKGGSPRWYARSFIISMAEKLEHIEAAAQKQIDVFGTIVLPVVPLFEESISLAESDQIIAQMIQVPRLKTAIRDLWNNRVEMMVGYSDSSKESGVLASRLSIAEALPRLEKVCLKHKVRPVFFHGSGGSIDRGGGSVEDQTAWWPKSALSLYKVTIQGEMVERSLSSPTIARGQLEHILESISVGLSHKKKFTPNKTLDAFAKHITEFYRQKINDPAFLNSVEKVTPYSYLNLLKIGSRPAKRASALQVSGLRAIPWILCWTQTRVLFPTWWGAGSAWQMMKPLQKSDLKKSYKNQPVFTSFIKALGFTLAKVEMPIWQTYVQRSTLNENAKKDLIAEFQDEFKKTITFYQELTGHKQLMWFKPWLGESIYLRSPMIHPLNLLQIIAEERKDANLLRVTVTGISSGMMTTG